MNIIAEMLDGGEVHIRAVSELPDPVPSNWIVPCTSSFLNVWQDLITHDGTQLLYKNAIDAEKAIACRDAESTQKHKPYMLKVIENLYVDLLVNRWTPALRAAGIIPGDHTITVENTDEPTNIGYLLYLRQVDFNVYDVMADEFVRLKGYVLSSGGTMDGVIYHDLTV